MIAVRERLATAIILGWLLCQPAYTKPVQEAVQVLSDVQDTDPNGFRLMMMCVALIFVLALSIMGATVWYMLKGKNRRKNGP